jgi:signal transduction histidine kinase
MLSMRHRFLAGFSLLQALLAAVAVARGVVRFNEAAAEAREQQLRDKLEIACMALREGVPAARLAEDSRLEAKRLKLLLVVETLETAGPSAAVPGEASSSSMVSAVEGRLPGVERVVEDPQRAGGRLRLRLSHASERAGVPGHRRRVVGLLLGGVAYVGLSVGAAAWLTRRWLRALRRMSDAARDLGLDPVPKGRLPVPRTEVELASFAETLNGFLDRLEADYATRNRFLADAAHELRTPLTALRAEIDVALRREREPGRYRQVLESNREEIVRLSSLIDGLLTLARADGGGLGRPGGQVDCVPLAEQALDRFRPLALERGVALELSRTGGADSAVLAWAEAASVERILDNLLSNALRHTPGGGRVTLGVTLEGSHVVLDVTDTGMGIPEAHVSKVFERFYRVESGRGAGSGAGLGLAIVKALVEAQGGSVRLESEVGRGTRVAVRFPVS